jgi:two-component system nitrate/nitrite response regulator NarL
VSAPSAASVARTPVRVMVVDDHTLFRRGLTALLGADPRVVVVGEAADAAEALARAPALAPEVVLLDNHLPGASGIDALKGLLEAVPGARVLMLTVSEDENDLARALTAGAAGYLLKTAETNWLVTAILRVMEGESMISPEMTTKLVSALRHTATPPPASSPDPLHALSPRERDILRELARGATNKEIARTLDIAETTVKVHVQSVLRKLDLPSRVHAALYAVEHRLI